MLSLGMSEKDASSLDKIQVTISSQSDSNKSSLEDTSSQSVDNPSTSLVPSVSMV